MWLCIVVSDIGAIFSNSWYSWLYIPDTNSISQIGKRKEQILVKWMWLKKALGKIAKVLKWVSKAVLQQFYFLSYVL